MLLLASSHPLSSTATPPPWATDPQGHNLTPPQTGRLPFLFAQNNEFCGKSREHTRTPQTESLDDGDGRIYTIRYDGSERIQNLLLEWSGQQPTWRPHEEWFMTQVLWPAGRVHCTVTSIPISSGACCSWQAMHAKHGVQCYRDSVIRL